MARASRTLLETVYGSLDREIWVFGYGSLMWRPDFPFVEEQAARIGGYHRALCHYSVEYRGTPEKPGVVLGLDRGGSCVGRAFRIAAMDMEEALRRLHAREMLRNSYQPRWLNAKLADECVVEALAYVARRDHELYTGPLSMKRTVELVLAGRGEKGDCVDYVRNTVAHLDAMGISDGPLHKVWRAVEKSASSRPAIPAGASLRLR